MKHFLFLYPIQQIFDHEVANHGWHADEGEEAFKERYSTMLNRCIQARYRQKGFQINYAVFDDTPVSDVIQLQSDDITFNVGMTFSKHTTMQPNGKFPYPNQKHILRQLNSPKILRIAGFHMWDCVEKLAKAAHRSGVDTLVDEDLTEFFPYRLDDANFKTNVYPSFDARNKLKPQIFQMFLDARKRKPWLWQDY